MKRMILLIYRDLSVPLPPIPGTALRGFWSRRLFEYTDIIVKREEALERALNSISSQWNSFKKKGKWKSGYGHWKVCQEMLFNTWDKNFFNINITDCHDCFMCQKESCLQTEALNPESKWHASDTSVTWGTHFARFGCPPTGE